MILCEQFISYHVGYFVYDVIGEFDDFMRLNSDLDECQPSTIESLFGFGGSIFE